MPRMQRPHQRPCADVSALRRAGHRHHQTSAESNPRCFSGPSFFCAAHWHCSLDFSASSVSAGNGSAQCSATASSLKSSVVSIKKSARGTGIDVSSLPAVSWPNAFCKKIFAGFRRILTIFFPLNPPAFAIDGSHFRLHFPARMVRSLLPNRDTTETRQSQYIFMLSGRCQLSDI